jgi:hypothetical protein
MIQRHGLCTNGELILNSGIVEVVDFMHSFVTKVAYNLSPALYSSKSMRFTTERIQSQIRGKRNPFVSIASVMTL